MDLDNLKIWDLPTTEQEALQFLQEEGIINQKKTCINGHKMTLYLSKKENKWRCNKRFCGKRKGVRVGTLLENKRLTFLNIVRFIYSWAHELTTIAWCAEQLGIYSQSIVYWNNLMREVCTRSLIMDSKNKIGGPGLVVEVDESIYSSSKSNAEPVLPPQWVFGGICKETKQCFLVTMRERSAGALLNAIKEHVEEGSIIISDCWTNYTTNEMKAAGYMELTVNQIYEFVDSTSGVHTQHIERMWGSGKWRNKKHRGTSKRNLDSYLAEFLWRQKFKPNIFSNIIKSIVLVYPPSHM